MDSNPFADPRASNPFADPSVQQATGAGNASQRQGLLDDYNPFADGNQTRPGQGAGIPPPRPAQTTQPAIMTPSEEPPPPYSAAGAQRVDTSELQRRQEDKNASYAYNQTENDVAFEEELEKKAAELQRKEQALKQVQGGARQNNFPPVPKFCPVGPCFYQDFSVDIPLEFQRIVKFVFFLWGAHVVVLFLNIWASLAYFIVDGDGGTTFGLSILWFVLFTPCSFVCWYRPLYKAFRSDSSFNFFVFFFVFFFQFCVNIIQCLGLTGFTVGIISGFGVVGHNLAAGLFMIFVGIFFALEAIISFAVLVKVHRIYRSTGASFQKAQQEFAQGVMRNETVQTAAADAAASAARGAVSGSYGSNNRY
ncbi:secretory carrier-associated membrane protein 1-like isoform X2 [Pomacea canaliculata]|uniref:secretory carrier-associated membrane protein 1-like isoform X2 n=1 Tax=Pomacea canaliculata TaxID=400727 RepID=UPI000D73ADD8|nr:secretory carrier-associated membrane protein 1-like isoform X2 [Pomacea canaliculata]